MTLNKNVGKSGEVITVIGIVNRKGKNGDVMIYNPTVNGKSAGKDSWISDARGYKDGSRFVASGVKVGNIVAVTGTLYDYAGGKLALENITKVEVVGNVSRDELVSMFADIPANVVEAENNANHTAPKAIITPDGYVKVYGKAKEVKLALASLYR